MNPETTSGESLNDTTIAGPQEGPDWRQCEDERPDCGEYEGEWV